VGGGAIVQLPAKADSTPIDNIKEWENALKKPTTLRNR
jgi:hypothetical protein